MPEDDDRKREEYLALLAIFERFIDTVGNMDRWEIIEELAKLRSEFALHHAIEGFGMDWEDAMMLITNFDSDLSSEEKARREILLAAMDNIVDFAVAEEYHVISDIQEIDLDEEISEEKEEELLAIFHKYNYRYANVENGDINYAMAVAAGLVILPEMTEIMYMTQGDERVRPWHLQWEGFHAPKRDFPAWLIPPIENNCRCFLITMSDAMSRIIADVKNAHTSIEMPDWFNRTFKESVALGGRIFSDEHPYFQIPEEDYAALQGVADRLKNHIFQWQKEAV